jgi:ribosomal protein S18 acetylase RimI-like enzyme
LADIKRLETACNQYDGLTMKLNWNTLQDRPEEQCNDVLCYADGQLLGYLALYGFNQREAEVSAMTHPAHRRQGIFKRLLVAANAELRERSVPDLLFICEQISTTGVACMQAIAARYEFSEYKMQWQEPFTHNPASSDLQLRPARLEDIAELVRLDASCFGVFADTAQRWLAHDISDPRRKVLLAALGPVTVGKINVLMTDTETYISGFCVWPEYRGQGYGKVILTRTLEQLLAERHQNIVLEVACENEHALTLYKHCGFRTVTAYDYYRLPVM